jgi:hypothetical protein
VAGLRGDTLIEAMPASLRTSAAGIEFAPDGAVIVGPEFRTLEAAWREGVAAAAKEYFDAELASARRILTN